jgi:chorismate synthase
VLLILTAGESHGPGLTVVVDGLPAGVSVLREEIDADLRRRQGGYGRGGRMKIETDTVEVFSGVRHGRTLGSPVSLLVRNKDHASWSDDVARPQPESARERRRLRYPPGTPTWPGP